MKRASVLGLAIIALFASGCDRPEGSSPPRPTPASAAPGAAASSPLAVEAEYPASEMFVDRDPSPLTRDEIIGTWSTDKDCWQQTVFSADGSFSNYSGGSGRWTLSNDRLEQTTNGRTVGSHVDQLNSKAFAYGSPNGLVVIYRRCEL